MLIDLKKEKPYKLKAIDSDGFVTSVAQCQLESAVTIVNDDA